MPRTRSETLDHTSSADFTYIDQNGNSLLPYSGSQTVNMPRNMTDEVTPGYFSAMRRGQILPVNPMSSYKTDTLVSEFGEASWDHYYKGTYVGNFTYTGEIATMCWNYANSYDFPPWVGSLPNWPDKATLVTESLANARSRGFDVLTFLVEFNKTVDLIARFRQRVLRRANRIAATIGGNNSNPLQAFADNWLEHRYGWRILGYDIEGINEAIEALKQLHSPYVRGYAEESSEAARVIQNVTTPSTLLRWPTRTGGNMYAHGYAVGSLSQTLTYRRRAGTLLEAVVSDIFEIDPLVTTWEVIPFSFIIDWFTNIGDLAQAYSPFATENLLDAWSTDREILTTTAAYTPREMTSSSKHKYYLVEGDQPFSTVREELYYSRTAESPSASLSFNVNLDAFKLLDLASIFLAGWTGILRRIIRTNRI